MAGFLAGPAAHLVGAGMQAIGVGIPVGQTSAKLIEGMRSVGLPVPPNSWFKRKESDADDEETLGRSRGRSAKSPRTNVYDELEAHVKGVMQVVKPVIELKQMVRAGCCKSADRALGRRANSQSPNDKLKYYTPQKCSSRGCNLFQERKSTSPKKKLMKKPITTQRMPRSHGSSIDRGDHGTDDDDDDDADSCMYCSSPSRSWSLKLPCGRIICSKCYSTEDHGLECKQCKGLI